MKVWEIWIVPMMDIWIQFLPFVRSTTDPREFLQGSVTVRDSCTQTYMKHRISSSQSFRPNFVFAYSRIDLFNTT